MARLVLPLATALGTVGCVVVLWVFAGGGDRHGEQEQRYLAKARSELAIGFAEQVGYLTQLAVAPSDVDLGARYTEIRGIDHEVDVSVNKFDQATAGAHQQEVDRFRRLADRYRGLRAVVYGQPPPAGVTVPTDPDDLQRAVGASARATADALGELASRADESSPWRWPVLLAVASFTLVVACGVVLPLSSPTGSTNRGGRRPDPHGRDQSVTERVTSALPELRGDLGRWAAGSRRMTDSWQRMALAVSTAGDVAAKAASAATTTATDLDAAAERVELVAKASASEVVDETSQAAIVEQAGTTARAAAAAVAALSAVAVEIGTEVTVISKIAESTHALAMNAAIEAARAGPAGRGFAVVAQEVRELSGQANHAASDIAERVTVVAADADRALVAIEEVRTTIERLGTRQAKNAADVASWGDASSDVLTRVTNASRLGTRAAARAAATVAAVREVAEQATTVRDAIADLVSEARRLEDLAARFGDTGRGGREASRDAAAGERWPISRSRLRGYPE